MNAGGGRADAATPARRAAFEVLRRVFEHDAWADRAFPAAAERHGLEGRERWQAQRLAFGAVQRRGTSDFVAGRLTRRGVGGLDPPVVAALRLGLFELLFSQVADHAAVDGAVELAKGGMRRGGGRRAAGASGLVNAVLRRAALERQALLSALVDDGPAEAASAHSVPEWLAKMWWAELGADSARSLLRSVNEPPETAMRVNTLRAEPADLRAALEAAGEPIRPLGPASLLSPVDALVWKGPLGEAALRALSDGLMLAQSRGAQAVVGTLGVCSGERVLDLCAGPGVKTAAIAAQLGGTGAVTAVERDPGRARQIEELALRAGAGNVQVVVADVAAIDSRHAFVHSSLAAIDSRNAALIDSRQGYDRVLVDPPCSDLGTLASRPDARWRKEPAQIAKLAALQGQILETGVAALRPGGTLVYSTCTISKAENEDVVEAALAANPGLEAVSELQTRPDRDGTDGFFIAELRKVPGSGG